MSSIQYPDDIAQEMRDLTERARQAATRGDAAEVRRLGERFQALREQTRNGGSTNRTGGRSRHVGVETPTYGRTAGIYGNILGELQNMDARLGSDIRTLEQIRNALPRNRSRGGAQDQYGGLLPPTYGTRGQSQTPATYRPRSGRVEVRSGGHAALPRMPRGPFPLTLGNRVGQGRRHYDYYDDEGGDEESDDDYDDEDDEYYY